MGSLAGPSDGFKVKRLRRGGNYLEWAAGMRAVLIEADLDSSWRLRRTQAMMLQSAGRTGARLDSCCVSRVH